MAAPVVASSNSASGTSSTVNVTAPTGTASGDLLIAVSATDAGTMAQTGIPTGFTQLSTSSYDGGSNKVHVNVGQKVAGSEPGTYAFAEPGSSSDSVAAVLRVTGADGTPVIVEVAPTVFGTSGAVSSPSLTPNGSDDLLICLTVADGSGTGGGAVVWTQPTGMTLVLNRQSTQWTALGVASLAAPSSPSGTKTWTPSGNHNKGAALTISVKAASSSVSGTLAGSTAAAAAAANAAATTGQASFVGSTSAASAVANAATLTGQLNGVITGNAAAASAAALSGSFTGQLNGAFTGSTAAATAAAGSASLTGELNGGFPGNAAAATADVLPAGLTGGAGFQGATAAATGDALSSSIVGHPLTVVAWSGDGLSTGTMTTLSAGTGDTAIGSIQGTAPSIVDDGLRSPEIEWPTATSYVVWGHDSLPVGAWRWYLTPGDPGGGYRIALSWAGSAPQWMLDVGFDGTLHLLDSAGSDADTSTTGLITPATTYRIEVTYDTGAVDVYVYTGESTTELDHLTATLTAAAAVEFWWGCTFDVTGDPRRGDDLRITDTATLIGPAGAAVDGSFTGSTAGATAAALSASMTGDTHIDGELVGSTAAATTGALPATLTGAAVFQGSPAAANAAANQATIAGAAGFTGSTAAATADGLEASLTGGGAGIFPGVPAEATAAALSAGYSGDGAYTGATASATAAANTGTTIGGATFTGSTATATATALDGEFTTTGVGGFTGSTAAATAAAQPAGLTGGAEFTGATASATAAANPADIGVITIFAGSTATATAAANHGLYTASAEWLAAVADATAVALMGELAYVPFITPGHMTLLFLAASGAEGMGADAPHMTGTLEQTATMEAT